jgi:surfactin synthase thioesterase subunit
MNNIHLFCFPFAGGNKYSYRQLEVRCPPFLRMIPLEYPGRGSRLKEPFIKDIYLLTEDLYREVKPCIEGKEYAFYGHSMGGLVAFFLAKKIMACGHTPPVHLFITSTTGPSAPPEDKRRHLLEKKEFIEEIRSLDGCPEDILQNDELLDFVEPILRADFEVSETFVYETDTPAPLPMTVVTGYEEDMEKEDILLWQKETIFPVDFRQMPGKHFFIFKYPFELVELISKKLLFHSKKSES